MFTGFAILFATTVASGATTDDVFVRSATIVASDPSHDLLKDPCGAVVMLPSGSILLSDRGHDRIVAVSPDGVVTRAAGNGSRGYADGDAAKAQFNAPSGMAVDPVRRVIYIADSGNNLIRVLTFDGVVSTLAGSRRPELADGVGAQAGFKQPSGVAVDAAGNVYVADTGNSAIRRITPAGVVTTLAGGTHEGRADGAAAQALFRQPEGIVVTRDGVVYVADTQNNQLRKIANGVVTTLVGTGNPGRADGTAATAELKAPSAIALDDAGNLFVVDTKNHLIRKVSVQPSVSIVTIAGTGEPGFVDGTPAASKYKEPQGVAVAGAIFIADTMNDALRVLYAAVTFSAASPRQGSTAGGNVVHIFGSGFVPGATQVTVGAISVDPSLITYVTSTELLVTMPAHAAFGAVDIVITTPGGTSTGTAAYTYVAPPTITSISPIKGTTTGGQTVTMLGTNFIDGETSVRVGAVSATAVAVLTPTKLTFVTPAGSSGAADVTVTTSAGAAALVASFNYFAPPMITSFSPQQGGAGTVITIAGTNFDADASGNQVSFGSIIATINSASGTQLVVAAPPGVTTSKINVTTAGGSALSANDFLVASFARLSVTAPLSAIDVGQTLALNATAFSLTNIAADVTAQATWHSSNAAVATASAAGVVSGVTAGEADVSASLGSLTQTTHVTVQLTVIPSEPSAFATVLDRTTVAAFENEIRFLYSGPNAIQRGVTDGAIRDERATVFRGVVRTRDGAALPGVRVSVLNHGEYGQTFSRADGVYDLVVNGGGSVVIAYEKPGYMSAQRLLTSIWNEQKAVDDVLLVSYDRKVTLVTMGAADVQVASGSVSADASGERKATLIVPAATDAVLVLRDGTTRSATALNIRATEYSIGTSGQRSMPAALPARSGYTYCVELSADEATAAGATEIRFSRPLPVYVENFLQFPVGMIVPSGYYDRVKGSWLGSDNGKVIRVLASTNGLANVDTNGDGAADDSVTLTALGIDDSERRVLATLYSASQSLWRIPVSHFTPWDFNLSIAPPPQATPPMQPRPDGPVNVPG
ncbi:MAG TPA: IPT/TIG domain-containing protein, partial [Thermoanaerobaculia bacterium]|nr:IPT/TIG domain-containing protein [Thermoanaerobaculia bacterium]